MITLTREEAQQVLDLLSAAHNYANECSHMATQEDCDRILKQCETFRARLSAPEPSVLNAIDCSCGRKWRVIDGVLSVSAAPEPEPVAWGVPNTRPTEKAHFMMLLHSTDGVQYPELLVPLYTAPPQREWVGLTHEEKMEILTRSISAPSRVDVAEAMLKEKNK